MWRNVAVALAVLTFAACGGGSSPTVGDTAKAPTSVTATSTAVVPAPPSTTTLAPEVPAPALTSTTAAPTTSPTTSAAPRVRTVTEQAWVPFGTVGGVTLHHPSARVEHIGFHQSNHDGARDMEPLPTAVRPMTLESRSNRVTGLRTAADVVVDPEAEIRSPVTGTVKRAGGYTLYCDHRDDFAVFEPDAQPGWEVKILHITGVQVVPGQRVEAGVTVIAPRPTPLPFESQVDERRTADPAWPHVHVEVVDPSIPDQPNPGGGC